MDQPERREKYSSAIGETPASHKAAMSCSRIAERMGSESGDALITASRFSS